MRVRIIHVKRGEYNKRALIGVHFKLMRKGLHYDMTTVGNGRVHCRGGGGVGLGGDPCGRPRAYSVCGREEPPLRSPSCLQCLWERNLPCGRPRSQSAVCNRPAYLGQLNAKKFTGAGVV